MTKMDSVLIYGKNYHVSNNKITLSNLNIKSIEDINSLDQFQDIYYIDLSSNKITEIKGLDNFKNLKYLNLENNNITEISGLVNFENLTYLNLGKNKITEINGLRSLINLVELDLSHNKISNISSLDSLKELQILNLTQNKIKEIVGLTSLNKLTDLLLLSNNIQTLSGLSQLNSLRFFKIDNEKLTTVDSFIYCQENISNLLQYSKKIEDGIFPKNFFDEGFSDIEKKIEIWDKVLSSRSKIEIMTIGKYQEDSKLKELQKMFFFYKENTPIDLNNIIKEKNLCIHLIQLHSLKGIQIPPNNENKDTDLDKFKFFLNSFWYNEIIEKDGALIYFIKELKSRINLKIEEMLYLSLKNKKSPDIIIFPENSIPECKIEKLINFSKINKCLIIGGLEHEKNSKFFINKAFIIDNGKIDYQIKQTPVYIEKEGEPVLEEPIECENVPIIKVFKTSIGKISIFICKDFLRLSYGISEWAKKNQIDWIIIPSLTMKVLPFYIRLMEIFTYSTYEKLKILFCNVGEYGGSEFFQRNQLKRIEKDFQNGTRDNIGEKIILRKKE